MKTILFILSFLAIAMPSIVSAQCASIDCPADITVYSDSTSCDAIVNFTAPVGVDTCNYITSTFSYTGAEQTYVVPSGVTSIIVDAYGAQGGANWASNDNYGGHVQAEIPVTPGTTIYVYVGEQPNGLSGGWNGGGAGETAGQGGGGASDIRIGGNGLTDRVVVAGAGGGAGFWSSQHVIGGAGGGLIGANGSRTDFATAPGGEGGTQSGSGNGTCVSLNNPACAGGFGYGGAPSSCGCEGYGGGGGWYGGAGSGNCRGGGGGSSYTMPSATNVVHNQGVRMGHGEVTISYPNGATTTTSQISGLSSGSVFPAGTTIVTYQAITGTDTTTCSFNVNVLDTIAPEISAPMDITSCASEVVNSISPVVWDNCVVNVNYVISGATNASGLVDASGTVFNAGVSTVWYYATDNSGNVDSSSFTVTAYDLPTVTLEELTIDTMCINNTAIILPSGTPSNGTYTGNGVSGNMFDPVVSGLGTHPIVYSYTDTNGCTNSDTVAMTVVGCASLDELSVLNTINVYPNPTKGNVTISLGTKANTISYNLFTAEGKNLLKGTKVDVMNVDLDLNQEEIGIYFLHLDVDGNKRVIKVLKE